MNDDGNPKRLPSPTSLRDRNTQQPIRHVRTSIMCGRYSLALRPAQVRAYLEDDNMPVYDAPTDDDDGAPRQSYNFAPGYHGMVYRADTSEKGAGFESHAKDYRGEASEEEASVETIGAPVAENDGQAEVRYILQSMKWGLIPFWTKRNPDYGSMMKTINCRDDSLIENRGMWTSMKNKKRCVVVAQGFYEWLKKGKEKVPHFTKRQDGKLMCFAGLWDCVQYEGSDDKHYTYTIITTDSNTQLNFLHDRMPVILENGSTDIRLWLDPTRTTWSKELQSLLRPFEGELDCYAVCKDVGKVGNNSPSFIIPVASSENKANIANFFAKGTSKEMSKVSTAEEPSVVGSESKLKHVTKEKREIFIKKEPIEDRKTVGHEGTEDNAPLPVPTKETKQSIKRELDDVPDDETPKKAQKISASISKSESPSKLAKRGKSSTSNGTTSPSKTYDKAAGSQKITKFFGK